MGNRTAIAFLGGFFLLLLGLAATRVYDWDIFWQLQSGRYIWQTQSMIRSDLFTLAAETPRWEHCWLHDLIFYAVWAKGGYAALSLFKGVLVTLTIAVLAAVAWRRRASLTAILLVLPLGSLHTYIFWKDRPQLWSFLAFALLLWLLEDFQSRGGRRIFLAVPLIALWANLHGAVLIALPVLLAYGVAAAIDGRRAGLSWHADRFRKLCLLFPLAVGALFLTPYGGVELLATLTSAAKGAALGASSGVAATAQNFDWSPWTLAASPAYLVAVIAAALLLILGRSQLRISDLLLLGGLAVMGFRLSRHIPFFLLATAALLPLYVDAIGRRMIVLWPRCSGVPARIAVTLLIVLLLLLPARMVFRSNGFFDLGLREWHFPVAAAEFLRTEKLPGRVFNAYEWGGYLEWQLYPDYRVFWDARQTSLTLANDGMRIMDGDPAWKSILARYGIDTIVLTPIHYGGGVRYASFLDPLRADVDWALVFAGGPALVFVRTAAVDAEWLAAHRLPDSRIDDVSLELTGHLLKDNPSFYRAHGERARIFLARGDFANTLAELERYMALCPPHRQDAGAVKVYQALRARQ